MGVVYVIDGGAASDVKAASRPSSGASSSTASAFTDYPTHGVYNSGFSQTRLYNCGEFADRYSDVCTPAMMDACRIKSYFKRKTAVAELGYSITEVCSAPID
jgi:hypothetical protein